MSRDLLVRRMTATFHLDADAGPRHDAAGRLQRLLRGVAERGLDGELRRIALQAGEWCVRRLDVAVPLELDSPDPALEAAWARSLVGSLQEALDGARRGPGPGAAAPWEFGTGRRAATDVVHYRTVRDAAVDLIASVAAGDRDRLWAWRQVGLLPGAAAAAAADAGGDRELMLAALAAGTADPLGVLVSAAELVGLGALDRALGAAGWTAVGRVVAAARGVAPPDLDTPAPGARPARLEAQPAVPGRPPGGSGSSAVALR